jgi:uncharacterized protein
MKLHTISFILLVVGGLNWLLVGLGGWNLVDMLLGSFADGMVERVVYILVGLSAVYEVSSHKNVCRSCDIS